MVDVMYSKLSKYDYLNSSSIIRNKFESNNVMILPSDTPTEKTFIIDTEECLVLINPDFQVIKLIVNSDYQKRTFVLMIKKNNYVIIGAIIYSSLYTLLEMN